MCVCVCNTRNVLDILGVLRIRLRSPGRYCDVNCAVKVHPRITYILLGSKDYQQFFWKHIIIYNWKKKIIISSIYVCDLICFLLLSILLASGKCLNAEAARFASRFFIIVVDESVFCVLFVFVNELLKLHTIQTVCRLK